jgi:hypothetical protein
MSPESSAALNRRRARLRRIPEIRSQKPEAKSQNGFGLRAFRLNLWKVQPN